MVVEAEAQVLQSNLTQQHMNNTPTQKNGDVDADSSASSTGGTYVPPARRNQILSGGNSRSNGPRDAAAGNADERFAGYRQNNNRGGFESRGPRSGSDNMTDRKPAAGNSFFDRPSNNAAPRRSKWQDDDYQGGGGAREDRGGRGRRPQVGADGLLPRDERLEVELFGNHSNTGINFDKYQVRFISVTIYSRSLRYKSEKPKYLGLCIGDNFRHVLELPACPLLRVSTTLSWSSLPDVLIGPN